MDHEDHHGADRRIIRIDCSPTQQGIAAALRRAFGALDTRQGDEEFDGLIARIH